MQIHAASPLMTPLLFGKTAGRGALALAATSRPGGARQPATVQPAPLALRAAGSPTVSRSTALKRLQTLGLHVQAGASEKRGAAGPAAVAVNPPSAHTTSPAAPTPEPAPAPQQDEEIILAQTQETPSLMGLFNAWGTDDTVHDLDGNGTVGVSDLLEMMQQFQNLLANWGQGDSPLGGENETIGVSDLLAFLGQA